MARASRGRSARLSIPTSLAAASASCSRGQSIAGAGARRSGAAPRGLLGNRFTRAQAINHFNADKPLSLASDGASLDFDTVTTGNFSGFDLWLDDRDAGALDIVSNIVCHRIDVATSALRIICRPRRPRPPAARVSPAGCQRRLAHGPHTIADISPDVDNPLYVRLTQEDGHQAWSSPIYVIP